MEPATASQVTELLTSLRADPGGSAVLSDIDGTLAPIVPDPAAAAVPEATREVLRELAERYALVGCLSGRRASEARRLIGLDELVYAGNHGFEVLDAGASEPAADPAVRGREEQARAFADSLEHERLEAVGLRREDKGAIQAFHWRGAPDEAAARIRAEELAALAQARDLVPHWGRKVLEVRPPGDVDKGSAIATLLRDRPIEHGFYGGDDTTDLDAFRALRALRDSGELRDAVCVGIASEEGPGDLGDHADLVVAGTEAYLDVLRELL